MAYMYMFMHVHVFQNDLGHSNLTKFDLHPIETLFVTSLETEFDNNLVLELYELSTA